jgi:hypothetical protein
MDKEIKNWSLSVGFYPGQDTHVIYIPFIDIAFEIYK